MEKHEIPDKDEDALMKGLVRTRGTCIAGIIGQDFIMIAGDGRGMVRKSENDIPWVVEDDACKLKVHDGNMISAIAGSADKCKRILKEVTDRLIKRERTGIFSFGKACNKVLRKDARKRKRGRPEPDDDENFDILCFGFDNDFPYLYSSKERKCTVLDTGSLHGIGCGFTYVEGFLENVDLRGPPFVGRTQEQIMRQLKMAFCATTLQSEYCGGFIHMGIITLEGATIRNEGHILAMMSTYFPSMKTAFARSIIVTTHGYRCSKSEHAKITNMLMDLFPDNNVINVLGVMKKREGREVMILSVFFNNEEDVEKSGANYGKKRIGKGLYMRKPTAQLFDKYATNIVR